MRREYVLGSSVAIRKESTSTVLSVAVFKFGTAEMKNGLPHIRSCQGAVHLTLHLFRITMTTSEGGGSTMPMHYLRPQCSRLHAEKGILKSSGTKERTSTSTQLRNSVHEISSPVSACSTGGLYLSKNLASCSAIIAAQPNANRVVSNEIDAKKGLFATESLSNFLY